MTLFDLVAKITLDTSGYESGLDEAEKQTSGFGDKIKTGLATAAKVGAAAIGTASTAITALTKTAVDGFAEYEQLAGGVETLFGDSAQKVIENANKAYNTAGQSANQYMETSIQSAAALINALGGDQAKAADLMDMSIVDMADNVNKMGTNMQSVQDAYRGFSRGNFTMLDNLALGFAGTKEGMQQLLDKAGEISGFKYDISSYADIVQAIHVVQEEMGIAGTTQAEAAGTISGSLSAVKAAWDNLVTGIANENSDFDTLVNNFVENLLAAGENLMPRIEQAILGIGKLIEGLAPVIAQELPILADKLVPPLIDASGKLIASLTSSIPGLIAPVFSSILGAVDSLGAAIGEKIPGFALIFDNLSATIIGVTTAFTAYKAAIIAQKVATIAAAIAQGELNLAMLANPVGLIVAAIAGLIAIVVTLWHTNDGFRDAVISAGKKVLDFVTNAVNTVVSFFQNLIRFVSSNWQGLLLTLVNPFAGAFKLIYDNCEEFRNFFDTFVQRARQWGSDLLQNFINGITSKVQSLWNTVKNIAQGIKDFLGFSEPKKGPLSNFHTYAPDMIKLFVKGIKDNAGLIGEQLEESISLPMSDMGGSIQAIMDRIESIKTPKFAPSLPDFSIRNPAIQTIANVPDSGYNSSEIFTVPRTQNEYAGRELNVYFQFERGPFAKLVYTLNNEETQRVGVKLAGGAV